VCVCVCVCVCVIITEYIRSLLPLFLHLGSARKWTISVNCKRKETRPNENWTEASLFHSSSVQLGFRQGSAHGAKIKNQYKINMDDNFNK
jgi:hypothetical protein